MSETDTSASVKTEVQWAVAYGGDDPNECAGVLEYDDQVDAEEHAQWIRGGFVACRTVMVGPWQRVAEAPVSTTGLIREPDATCSMCSADHCLIQPGFSCTVHGHAFVYVCTQDGEERDECPEVGCSQGMWTS